MQSTMNAGDWLRLAALSAVWGSSFLFYKVLGKELPPLTIVFGRVALGALVLWFALRLRGCMVRLPRDQWGNFLVLGALTAAPFALFVIGETRVSSGTAAILNATTPLFVALTTAYFYRTEVMTFAKLAGIGCGVAGVAVLVGSKALLGQDLVGQGACLLAAICYGFGLPYGRRVVGVDPASMALGQLVAATVLLVPLLPLERPWALPTPGPAGIASLLGVAVCCTSMAYLIYFDLLMRAGAGNLSLVTLLVPVSALFLGAIVLHEPIAPTALAGMALIFAGLAVGDGRLTRRAMAAAGFSR
jgi:drug/metabolite transporter (DMT)-like permease